ncbi:PREDICTED: probable G-protein coupled receptor 150 [Elephantulus edwardii]|uniref:probable G-protein coupled receptor 150 n=1 Tax=Elephantulus edwardii TaxID=28737 RepID=UPI0003F0AF31|nr:PREDICTED: probable G-protein coupled receptor 150 [Elephantulus edwardii]
MDDSFGFSTVPPAPNLSAFHSLSWSLNLTSGHGAPAPGAQPLGLTRSQVRLVFLGVVLVVAVVGNAMVLCRLCGGAGSWAGPKRRKMDFLLVQLALADLYACGGSALSQLVWELLGAPGPASGDLACRSEQLLQASGRGASAHLVALIALEPPGPHQPPATPAVRAGAGGRRCRSIFAPSPRWHLQIYTLYEVFAGFVAPVAVMSVACSRLLCAWWQRRPRAPAAAAPWSESPGRAPAPNALPRAKVQSLKMSLVLALLFVGCELPSFAAQLAAAWSRRPTGDAEGEEGLRAVLHVLEVANHALNPFVYFFFQTRHCRVWRKRLVAVCCARKGVSEDDEEDIRSHQALHRHRWPHPHYHHARREQLEEGCMRPPPPRPRPPPCSCESVF